MPNLAQSLKAEIQRISRREIKSSVTPIHASNVALKKSVAELKKRIASLEAENKRLLSSQKPTQERQSSVSPEKVRITAKSIRALRNNSACPRRSREAHRHYEPECFCDGAQGRQTEDAAYHAGDIMAVRGIGKREAKRKLGEMKSSGE